MRSSKAIQENLAPIGEEAIERIVHNNEVYAVIVHATLPYEGYNFVTDEKDSLQVGVNHYKAKTEVRPHFHLPVPRALKDTLEVLHIDSGRCLLKLFDDDKRKIHESELLRGDTVVLMKGGHGLKILEETRIVEVKQGPYPGQKKDKSFFEE